MTALLRLPFSRSYGVILPSSLTRVLSFVLGFSPRPPASVCGTGTVYLPLAPFLASLDSHASLLNFDPRQASALCDACLTASQLTPLDRLYHQPAHAILLCQCFTLYGGTGISTSYPSPTTSVLGLGPDLPWADEPSPGNLGLSTCKFLAYISLLIPAFSLLYSPRLLPVPLQPVHYAPLPLISEPEASVVCFSPVTSSAHNHSTSELLRTL